MTVKIEKEVCRPGTAWYIDAATGQPRMATFTPETIRYFHDQGKAMLAAKLSIPVPLEHQPLLPMTAAERAANLARHNAGWVADYKFKKIKDDDGKDIEALFSEIDIEDLSLVKKLPRTIRWTSPWISSFTDGTGKAWNSVISHLALTTRPRLIKQQPFPSLEAAMSLAGALQEEVLTPELLAKPGRGAISLSRAGMVKKRADNGKLCPAYPMAFALYSGVGFADDVPVDMKNDKKAPDGKKPPPDNKPPGEGEEAIEQSLIDEDGDISIYEVLQDLLEAVGVPIEQGSNEGNFFQRLYKAAMEKVKGGGSAATEPGTPMNGNQPSNKPGTIAEQPPLYMSLEQAQAIQDPLQKQMALSIITLQEQNKKLSGDHEALRKNAFDTAAKTRQARIDRLSAKLAPAAKTSLTQLAAGAGFSLGDDGKVADALDATLTMLEASIPDLPALLSADKTTVLELPHPRQYNGEMSEQRRQEVVNEQCKNGSIRVPAKAS